MIQTTRTGDLGDRDRIVDEPVIAGRPAPTSWASPDRGYGDAR